MSERGMTSQNRHEIPLAIPSHVSDACLLTLLNDRYLLQYYYFAKKLPESRVV
jgi:hypothetical protein